MTTYIYKNQYGVEVNENQIDNLDTYYKVTLISSTEKIVELIENNVVSHISYNLETSETIASLLPSYMDRQVSFIAQNFVNNYLIKELKLYDLGQLELTSKTVYDVNNKIICFQKSDINTNTPILATTEKRYYDSSGTEKYFFDYNDDGSCFMVYDCEFDEEILASTIGQPNVDFTWVGFEYYQNALPVIPV